MDRWLAAALDYLPTWIDHQMRLSEQPGCTLAVASKGKLVFEAAFGHADLARQLPLTPQHRFRVASHSKTFAAAAIMKLREQGRLQLDDAVGRYVKGLHPSVAKATLTQLLSHTAGLVRDGSDASQWQDRRPFLNAQELLADLADGPTIDANTRFKYSNHGYGLVGLVIEAVTGESFGEWTAREIVAASGLEHTTPDMPASPKLPFAHGHSSKMPLGRRVVIPATNPTNALAAATGFVSTAGDLARFFGSLAPGAKRSVLKPESRREMVRRQWKDAYGTVERWYGLGTISGKLGEWEWFGHSGGFQGTITRTCCVPEQDLTVSVLTNAADGISHVWLDGALHIFQAFAKHGAPSPRTARWGGRYWSLWGAFDFVPVGGKVLIANPNLPNPMQDASQVVPDARRQGGTDSGLITLAGGFANHGERARIERDARDRVTQAWVGGTRLVSEAKAAKELAARYAADH
ncbi:serine hydrolase domain-containing protein [Ideonella sp.]|uniref:serine hydrolase domain-containing protein n=1 Tax=Ideonella sp. TaxID=1929293 RepID=UPI0035B2B825